MEKKAGRFLETVYGSIITMENVQVAIVLLIAFISHGKSNEIDDYVNLIQQEQQRAREFTLPSDSKNSKPYGDDYIEYGTFDYIVVGAGSAGAVVASRLSEDSFRNVLLLEAGGPETNFTEIPGMVGTMLKMEYNWNYYTVPQKTSCLGMYEKRCAYPRGKMLGGSSGINGQVYSRGSKKDYDNWCSEGNPGWCFKDILPFFKMSENSEIDGDPGYHGHGGYVNVEYAQPINEKSWALINAHKELKLPLIDYNGKRQIGVGITQFTEKKGRRRCTSRAFLKPALNRPNLKILIHSHVTRILITSKTKRAVGVVFARNNGWYVAKARKEVIVSAGAIGSPQLLMLSGIGPKIHLQNIGIPVVHNLDVGKNFQDHVAYGALHIESNISIPFKSLHENVEDYLNGVGDLADPFIVRVLTFVQTRLASVHDFPDFELMQFLSSSDYLTYKPVFNYDVNTYEHGWAKVDFTKTFTMYVAVLHPKSRGTIELKSTDPFDYPLIDSNLLSDSRDFDTLYEGIQFVLQLLKTTTLKKVNARLFKVHLPACKHLKYLSEQYWHCQIRHLSTSFTHPVGTCKMGPNPLGGAVVDHKLRVHGIKNLRIADASVIPTLMGAHTNAPSIMIGEKAAHMIRFQ